MIHLKAAWKQISTLRQCPSAHRNSWVTLVLAATHCLDGWCWSFFSCLDQFRKVFLSMTILFGRGKLTIQMTHVGETYSIQDHWGGCRCLWLLCLCFNHALSIAGNLRMGAFSVVWNSMKGYVWSCQIYLTICIHLSIRQGSLPPMLVNENYKVFYSNRDLTLQFQRLGRLRLGEFAYISSDALKLLHNKCTLHLAARIPFHYAGSCLPLLQLKVIWDDVGKYIGFCFVRLRCECFCKHVLSQPRPLQLMHQNRCDRPGTV